MPVIHRLCQKAAKRQKRLETLLNWIVALCTLWIVFMILLVDHIHNTFCAAEIKANLFVYIVDSKYVRFNITGIWCRLICGATWNRYKIIDRSGGELRRSSLLQVFQGCEILVTLRMHFYWWYNRTGSLTCCDIMVPLLGVSLLNILYKTTEIIYRRG